jgi:hypothetical protein
VLGLTVRPGYGIRAKTSFHQERLGFSTFTVAQMLMWQEGNCVSESSIFKTYPNKRNFINDLKTDRIWPTLFDRIHHGE